MAGIQQLAESTRGGVERARGRITRLLRSRKQSPPQTDSSDSDEPDITEQLKRLEELRDFGLLTEAEFIFRRAELLAQE